MNASDWHQIEEIVMGALELTAADRPAFLTNACKDYVELRMDVESLLAQYNDDRSFLESGELGKIVTSLAELNESRFIGKKLGIYRLVREIGSGGMGTVFLAKRDDGEFEQEVAIKVVRQTLVDNDLMRHFRRERQILASLNHPNIAQLFDGGVTEDGTPFLVMEHIEGVQITDFAGDRKLDIRSRLTLFVKVCSAVAFAHRNLIVHRDLKPGNILVTADGEPKLLDFGLAKLISENRTDGLDRTQTTFRALTPAYASPEQLAGGPITTYSDVYSLGIVLYELLTGLRPFQFDGKSLDEIVRTVNHSEPMLPSRSDPSNSVLKGDLDNIVLTALSREPERRYRSAEKFSDDIERYLLGLPVSARTNTRLYRASKFVRRHRIGVAATVLILLTFVGGMAATIWQSRQTQRQKEKAEKINAFLEKTLNYSNPIFAGGKQPFQERSFHELIDGAAQELDGGEYDDQPEVKVALESTIASLYLWQGNYIQASKHLDQYVALTKQLYGNDDPRSIVDPAVLAAWLFARNELPEAEATYRQYLPSVRNAYLRGTVKPQELALILDNFAYLRRTQGDSHEAELLFREALDLTRDVSEDDRKVVTTTRSTLASTIADQGRFDEALATARQSVDEFRNRGESTSTNYGFSLTVLGGFLTENGELSEAETDLSTAENIFREQIPSSLWLGDNLRNQGLLLYEKRKYAEAIAKADETRKIYDDNFGEHYDHYPTVLIIKGLSLAKMGQEKNGEEYLRKAVEMRNLSLPAGHYWVAAANGALGEILTSEGRYDEAEPLLLAAYESLKTSQRPGSPRLRAASERLVTLYEKWGKNASANLYRGKF